MQGKDTCDIYCYDEEKVNRIQQLMTNVDLLKVAKLFKALSDENRAKIVYSLCEDDELCVCDIANIIGSTVANTSHHLRTLHKQGIVKYRREGKLVFYSLDDEHMRQLMLIGLEHVEEVKANV
ncbi:ArsR/SmtB family transcription factor [Robertmurraya andreesenii]|uniref:DNA-binding transcriptional ArsR family regulator n=1 Tax=Anoxybacillus andreesenii TaxID=1325932 RepID=A0ABT9V1F7_9BACL|nr:metalloregulator ArsR/SmtB family transcription factor [Robertmurraya andreesenii]MDQ0154769.1 DNA-binding transcriptional ArsR family regulator [Robertmurraya andreesenii]